MKLSITTAVITLAALFRASSAAECALTGLTSLLASSDVSTCSSDSGYSFASLKVASSSDMAAMCSSDACLQAVSSIQALALGDCTVNGVGVMAKLVDPVTTYCASATSTLSAEASTASASSSASGSEEDETPAPTPTVEVTTATAKLTMSPALTESEELTGKSSASQGGSSSLATVKKSFSSSSKGVASVGSSDNSDSGSLDVVTQLIVTKSASGSGSSTSTPAPSTTTAAPKVQSTESAAVSAISSLAYSSLVIAAIVAVVM